ncbi:MAG: Hpt domain-containing protein [Thermodesulfobacteriota bacterium]
MIKLKRKTELEADMPSELTMEFIEDAREHLQAAGGHLLALEKDPSRSEDLHGLLRALHTIKGNAGFLDFQRLYGLLHKAENVLQTVREQSCSQCPQGLLDELFQVLDTVEAMLDRIERDEPDEVEWLDRLAGSLDGIDQALNSGTPAVGVGRSPLPAETTATGPGLVEPAAPSPRPVQAPSQLVPPDPATPLKRKIEGFLHHLASAGQAGPEAAGFEDLEAVLDKIGSGLMSAGGPRTREAWEMIRTFLEVVRSFDLPLTGAVRTLLEALGRNLLAWIGVEPPRAPGVVVVVVKEPDLDDHGRELRRQVEELIRNGAGGVLFDLREFQTLHSSQIGALLTAAKLAPDPQKVGLLVDSRSQRGLARVLHLMALEKVFHIFEDLDQARAELG